VIRTRGWIAPAFGLLLHSPDVAERIAAIGEFFLYQTIVPARAKALAWLVTARELDCRYTWNSGVVAAVAAGVDRILVGAIENGIAVDVATGDDRLLIEFCLQLLRGNHHVSDTIYDAVAGRYGITQAIQVSTAVGYVAMMSLIVGPFDLPNVLEGSRPAL